MRIAPPPAPSRRQPGRPQPPVGIDDLGRAALVLAAPTTEEAWIALTERLPAGGGYLVARLVATTDRMDAATAAVAHALVRVGERRRTDPPVPAAWVERLADLVVEELEAAWALDDAAHAAAVEPRWVELARGERAVPAAEQSWARVARIVAREVQEVSGMALPDDLYDRWLALDAGRDCTALDAEAARENGRAAVRWCVRARYGGVPA